MQTNRLPAGERKFEGRYTAAVTDPVERGAGAMDLDLIRREAGLGTCPFSGTTPPDTSSAAGRSAPWGWAWSSNPATWRRA